MKLIIILTIFFLVSSFSFSQNVFTQRDVEICNSKFEFAVAQNLVEKPINEIFVEIGKTFLGVDYEAFTLEKGDTEQLVIHLSGLDCYTFFESSLVFARCIKKGKTTFEDYKNELKKIRYRNSKIDGYPSRLHYASDWLHDNAKRGIVKDITKQIGGIEFAKNSYKQLKNNLEFIAEIIAVEDSINSRDYYYIPQNFVECIEDSINNGDIILLTASADGLDISHTGIAVKMNNGKIHFMHAPLKGKKIEITKKPLHEYIKDVDGHNGLMIARLVEPIY